MGAFRSGNGKKLQWFRLRNWFQPFSPLRRSVGNEAAPAKAANPAKKPRKAAAGKKEMLMPIAGKKPTREAGAKKPAAAGSRRSA
jgi:hypothetical protein